jgi:hypothetical protein
MTTTTVNKKTQRRKAHNAGQQTQAPAASHHGTAPVLKLLLGLLLIGFFLLALMLQIQTSEAFLLGSSPVQLAANWGVLNQPLALLQGQLPLDIAKAVMWGWGIELVYLVCVVGEVSIQGRLGGWFKTGAVILVVFNFWTDFNYGQMASGFWGQVAFAAITSFIVAFFGVLGLTLIWESITGFSR